MVAWGAAVESEIRYYRRRACEEMGAANRAVTGAARQRRLQLVDLYVQRLEALKVPNPFANQPARPGKAWATGTGSAFAWPGPVG